MSIEVYYTPRVLTPYSKGLKMYKILRYFKLLRKASASLCSPNNVLTLTKGLRVSIKCMQYPQTVWAWSKSCVNLVWQTAREKVNSVRTSADDSLYEPVVIHCIRQISRAALAESQQTPLDKSSRDGKHTECIKFQCLTQINRQKTTMSISCDVRSGL